MGAFDWFWRAMGSGTSVDQKRSKRITQQADARAADFRRLTDAELYSTAREAVTNGSLVDPPTFIAALAEATQRTIGQTPFPVQLQGVLRVLAGDVIQMATGEGKTLVGAMSAVGYALMGKRVHVVTVNDYLADRDAEWMRALMEFFDLSVGAVTSRSCIQERREAYAANVVYAPVAEIGFDVLRDRRVTSPEDVVQESPDVALVDEADSVLVDEALVPLVLAGNRPGTAPAGQITQVVGQLREEKHFHVDADGRTVQLTDEGARVVERALGISSLYDDKHIGTTLVQVNVALHARALLIRDVHYLVRAGKVQLIDSSRGRVADLQRWPDGLQAAVESKEGLDITEGGVILDTMTLQELMTRYPVVCGMTGTAVAATDQLRQFYGLRVSVIERNEPLQRFDEADRIYATREEKDEAILAEIEELHRQRRPVLVGTHDVAESEELAQKLNALGITASVLNAKNDYEEARIVAEAGGVGQVTVSTQMAGRGTDIKLGGADAHAHDDVAALGGLAVIGTSRHRTKRLDDQLRGRAGRQGDPGLSLFFVSLDDDVVRAGSGDEHITARPGPGGLIEGDKVRSFVDHCQRVTEGQLLEIHAQTWKYNQILAEQRPIIDNRRHRILTTDLGWKELAQRCPERAEQLTELSMAARTAAGRAIMLYHLDSAWSEYLSLLDEVRESIHLRAIARETPLDEYHRIAVREFKDLAQRAVSNAVATFQQVAIDEEGAHLDDLGLARPSATWTYMVSDNPLSGSGGSLSSSIGNIFR